MKAREVRPFRNGAPPADPPTEGQSDHCLWCGRKLRAERAWSERMNRPRARGDYGDNAFCGLRCGYAFGVYAADKGFRFAPRGES